LIPETRDLQSAVPQYLHSTRSRSPHLLDIYSQTP
jgi:hypothetical protein